MKATGIIRRVDDLGRVAIAKSIRQQLKIEENASLEFFIDGENIVLRKYKPRNERSERAVREEAEKALRRADNG